MKMAMQSKYLWTIILLFLSAGAVQAATMYKWVDENGTVQYTQMPPPEGKQGKAIETKPSPEPAEPVKTDETATEPSLLPPGLQLDKGDAGKDLDSTNCFKARKNLEILMRNREITMPDGKKMALSEEMRQQKIDEAREDMKKDCGY